MAIKIAINGYGRIGRNILRSVYELNKTNLVKIVAINDLGDAKINAHLTKYDTTHGIFNHNVIVEDDCILVDNDKIKVFSERDPSKLPWGDLGIDIVFECTGIFTSYDKAYSHIKAGAKKVLISAPGGEGVNTTIVYGVNNNALIKDDIIVSNASCTTNCLAPVVKPLASKLGFESGLMTTVHAYTNDQVLNDVYHSDLRRARSATHSMIPTKTGAAAAVGKVLPELAGRLDGFAIRVPVINVSVVDLTFTCSRGTSVEEVNEIVYQAKDDVVLGFNNLPLVSSDFNHNSFSSIFDSSLTKVKGNLVKVCSWYDNEWGFSCRMIDTSLLMMKL